MKICRCEKPIKGVRYPFQTYLNKSTSSLSIFEHITHNWNHKTTTTPTGSTFPLQILMFAHRKETLNFPHQQTPRENAWDIVPAKIPKTDLPLLELVRCRSRPKEGVTLDETLSWDKLVRVLFPTKWLLVFRWLDLVVRAFFGGGKEFGGLD